MTLVLITLGGCGQLLPSGSGRGNATATSSRNDQSIWRLIDRNIPVKDKDAVYDELAILPPYARKNVLFYSHGRFYSNRLSMLHGAWIHHIRLRRPTSAVSPSDDPPPCSGNGADTGVVHKFCTDAGFQFFSGTVYVDCHDSYLFGNHGENGFLYSGGTSPAGAEIDAGLLIKGPFSPGMPGTAQAMIQLPNGIQATQIGGPIHPPCDQAVTFQFWPAQGSAGDPVSLTDYIVGYGTLIYRLDKSTPIDNLGWAQTCNCRIKRVTSLAVPAGYGVVPGSYFGVQNPFGSTSASNGPTPAITWRNIEQGQFSGYGSTATPATEPWQSTQAYDDPSNAQQLGVVLSHLYSSDSEDAGINETQHLVIHGKRGNQ